MYRNKWSSMGLFTFLQFWLLSDYFLCENATRTHMPRLWAFFSPKQRQKKPKKKTDTSRQNLRAKHSACPWQLSQTLSSPSCLWCKCMPAGKLLPSLLRITRTFANPCPLVLFFEKVARFAHETHMDISYSRWEAKTKVTCYLAYFLYPPDRTGCRCKTMVHFICTDKIIKSCYV